MLINMMLAAEDATIIEHRRSTLDLLVAPRSGHAFRRFLRRLIDPDTLGSRPSSSRGDEP